MSKSVSCLLAGVLLLTLGTGCRSEEPPAPPTTPASTAAAASLSPTERPTVPSSSCEELPPDTTAAVEETAAPPVSDTKPAAVPTTGLTTAKTTKTAVPVTTTTRRWGGGVEGSRTKTVPASTAATLPEEADDTRWEPVWAEEFDGNVLNPSRWIAETGDRGNHYYTDRPENVRVENGQLVLTARREPYKGKAFTSAAVNTGRKFSFCYGKLEFRARLPYGKGVWPAFWTMGDDYLSMGDERGWPYAGEIDVMEMVGEGREQDRNTAMGNKIVSTNLHWGKDRAHHRDKWFSQTLKSGIWADRYHLFSIEWDRDCIRWFIDGDYVREIDINDPTMGQAFHKPHWLLISLQLADFNPAADRDTPLPQSLYVDYVRVYKRAKS